MYIERLTLSHLRGFEDLSFNFERPDGSFAGWTVFTGDNGSGKSTLLKAMALALIGPDIARALQPTFHRWIREGSSVGSIEMTVVQTSGEDSYVEGGRTPKDGRFGVKMELVSGTKEPTLRVVNPKGIPADRKNYQTPQRSIWSVAAAGWFACGYGPFRRVFGASPEAMRLMVAPTTERFVTMFQEAASLAEVNQWLLTLNHKKLEGREAEKKQLDNIIRVLRDDLLPNELTIDGVDSDGLWLRDRQGTRLAWAEMSDGYRSALALLCDILRNMSGVYGAEGLISNDPATGRPYVNRSGVVLIDEVDAHLHPEWQREIGFWLKRHFPRVQFLVTSHSPLVCQAADGGGLFVLPEPGSSDRPRQLTEMERMDIVAARADEILRSPAFGLQNTRSPLAVEKRADYSQLRAKQRSGKRLTATELEELGQLKLWVRENEEA